MSVCGLCARAGDAVGSHCGWCTCCSANRTGNVGGGRSPMAGNQKARGGCLMLPRPILQVIDHIARLSPAYRAAGFKKGYPA